MGNDTAMQVLVHTIQGLLAPRRLLPISIVCVPMIALEWRYFGATGIVLALGIFGGFLLIGPAAYRLLFPVSDTFDDLVYRVFAFLLVDLSYTAAFGVVLPRLMDVQGSLLTDPLTLYSAPPLFWAGSWALGRDLDWEAGMVAAKARYEAMEREAQRAQLLALRSHLDPHFLFNTLNAIAEWCRDDPAVAERGILQLSGMLRTMLTGVKAQTWPLEREFELSRQLLDLHHARDPGRFRFDVTEHPDGASVLIPPLLLLPVVENAIKHGPAAGHDGVVTIESKVVDGHLELVVANPGSFGGRREGGEGIAMVEERLRLAYEGKAEMSVESDEHQTTVRLRLPLVPTGEAV